MTARRVGTPEEWRAARLDLLDREKALNRARDELAEQRRALPWVRLDSEFVFQGPNGAVRLRDLFNGCSQLLVYHFMFGPDWDEGCPSCSFWADSFDRVLVHLAHRDVTLACVSHAPYDKVSAYRERMGWHFPWYSSTDGAFNRAYGVSFTAEEQRAGGEYNFAHQSELPEEAPGISVFALADDDAVFHTYSTYSRGLDPVNSAYQLLDLVPKGRDEAGLEWPMQWLKRHDAYA